MPAATIELIEIRCCECRQLARVPVAELDADDIALAAASGCPPSSVCDNCDEDEYTAEIGDLDNVGDRDLPCLNDCGNTIRANDIHADRENQHCSECVGDRDYWDDEWGDDRDPQ